MTKKRATKAAKKTVKQAARKAARKPDAAGNPPEVILSASVKRALVIASETLVHFGAGYCAEAAREPSSPVPPPQPQPPSAPPFPVPPFPPLDIFNTPEVVKTFQVLLLASTFKHKSEIDWFTPGAPDRRVICKMAFLHGMYARQIVVRDHLSAIDAPTLKESFDMVHKYCPSTGGGGPVCNFDL